MRRGFPIPVFAALFVVAIGFSYARAWAQAKKPSAAGAQTARAAGGSGSSSKSKAAGNSTTRARAATGSNASAKPQAAKPASGSTKRAATGSSKNSKAARAAGNASQRQTKRASRAKPGTQANAQNGVRRGLLKSQDRKTTKKAEVPPTSFLDQLADRTDVRTQACIDQYVSCMDKQIAPVIDKYEYIEDDEAYQIATESGETFRCAFWDRTSASLNPDPTKKDTKTCFGVGVDQRCYEQEGFNELYSAYNYHCDVRREHKNSIGRFVNQCKVGGATQFATKFSIAYYAEVLDRIDGDGLKMVNFQSSSIFTNFMRSLELADMDTFVIDPKISQQLLEELGIKNPTDELFAVRVAPPAGAGNYVAKTRFGAASDACFRTDFYLPEEEKNAKSRNEKNLAIAKMEAGGCNQMRRNLERYYLTGVWEEVEIGLEEAPATEEAPAAAKLKVTPKGSEVQTAFGSARDSCHNYENSLISVRDAQFALFDSKLQNYIEDVIAGLVQKQIRQTAKVTAALNAFQAEGVQYDADARAQKTAIDEAKHDAALSTFESVGEDLRRLADQASDAAAKARGDLIAAKKTELLAACAAQLRKNWTSADKGCGTPANCFSPNTQKFEEFLAGVITNALYINKEGAMHLPIDVADKGKYEFTRLASTSPPLSAITIPEGYTKISCLEVPGYDASQEFFKEVKGFVDTNYKDKSAAVASRINKIFSLGFGQ